MNKITTTHFNIYLAYPTCRNDNANFYRILKNYKKIGTEIKAYLIDWEKMDDFPKINMYVPAEHEAFVHTAYDNGFLTEAQILTINCNIISKCNLVILFGGFKTTSGDVLREVQYAREQGIAIYTMPDLTAHAISTLKFAIITILKAGE